ncbi:MULTISPECIES: GXWXG domain-containing protein [Agrobacterium]|uniref:DUF4334 domain-containing protein n=1 Tax=Agrobacterium tumefaciens TaxID=358 RepID=A0AAE6EHX9_AGRTU|nr:MULTISPECIES: GXWXG domain-containing protein [Agrobacterium]QCL77026.1 DUF4334 domain-containing protein [Agrobacterium tumefaciens]QCL82533.1 DUF4334 domain-containing protein [Agrobacterium tumefaciens]CUX71024.1 conserved hypothetical protein [Agrobacterium sp. NCPPB 925]
MLDQMLRERNSDTATVLRVFDELDPVSTDFLIGRWKGFVIATDHPMDSLLDTLGWYGKVFKGVEDAHPLIVHSLDGTELFAIDPSRLPLSVNATSVPEAVSEFTKLSRADLRTSFSGGRLRTVRYREKLTGSLLYDARPILDHFAKIDANTILGIMDFKDIPQAGAFVLERDEGNAIPIDL